MKANNRLTPLTTLTPPFPTLGFHSMELKNNSLRSCRRDSQSKLEVARVPPQNDDFKLALTGSSAGALHYWEARAPSHMSKSSFLTATGPIEPLLSAQYRCDLILRRARDTKLFRTIADGTSKQCPFWQPLAPEMR